MTAVTSYETPGGSHYIAIAPTGRPDEPGCVVCLAGPTGGVSLRAKAAGLTVPASDVPGVAAKTAIAMHEAAGLPAPVILDRPDITTDIHYFGERRGYQPSVGRNTNPARPVHLVFDGGMTRTEAYELAALLAAYADTAPEPDPAEVAELAEVLGTDCTLTGMARAVIAAGWARPKVAS